MYSQPSPRPIIESNQFFSQNMTLMKHVVKHTPQAPEVEVASGVLP